MNRLISSQKFYSKVEIFRINLEKLPLVILRSLIIRVMQCFSANNDSNELILSKDSIRKILIKD